MVSVATYAGLDYHQHSVQVCVLDEEGRLLGNRSVENDAAVVAQAASRYGRPRRVAVEACCGAADLADELAATHGLLVQLAHPGYVNRLKQSPDKTDWGDARLLADLTRINYLPRVWLAPEAIRQLRRLMRHRTQLVRRRKDVKLRLRGLLRENRLKCDQANAWTKAWLAWLATAPLGETDRWLAEDHLEEIAWLTQRLKAVEAQIVQRVKDDPVVQRLMTLEGVGLVTAATMRAEIGDFSRFDTGKQLARFCGVTPRNASSGQRQADSGLVKAGSPELRRVLVELAHRLMRRPGDRWGRLGHDLVRRGKPKNVAIAAVANRWVRQLHHRLREQPTA
ncbi:MAG: IS110 family transposase [Actinobacteria bacterium]|nr:IS110 family transposase [Actinomycetota bacterium]